MNIDKFIKCPVLTDKTGHFSCLCEINVLYLHPKTL